MTETLIPVDSTISPSGQFAFSSILKRWRYALVFPWPVIIAEERRRTGRYVAVALVVIACLLGLHHAFVKQNMVLAGFIVPALIMVFYIVWVLHTAKKSSGKHAVLEIKDVPKVKVKASTVSPADPETSILTSPSAPGILNNAAETL